MLHFAIHEREKKLREVDVLFSVFYGFPFNGNKVPTMKLHA